MKYFSFIICCVFSSSLLAAPLNRSELLTQLMLAQGIPQTIEQTRLTALEGARQNMANMNALPLDNPLIKPECAKKIGKTFSNYLSAIEQPVPAAQINQIYADLYKDFSDSELNELNLFYQSPTGKKELSVNPAIPPEFLTKYTKIQQDRLESNAQVLTQGMPNMSSCVPSIFKIIGAIK